MEIFSITQAATAKNVTRNTIDSWIKNGLLNTAEIGGRRLVVKDEKFDKVQVRTGFAILVARLSSLEAKLKELESTSLVSILGRLAQLEDRLDLEHENNDDDGAENEDES